MTLHNAPPTHWQVTAVALILILLLLFAITFFCILLTAVRRERAREDA